MAFSREEEAAARRFARAEDRLHRAEDHNFLWLGECSREEHIAECRREFEEARAAFIAAEVRHFRRED